MTVNYKKAQIINVKHKQSVECMFNPKELTLSKTVTLTEGKVAHANMPKSTFGGGEAMTLNLELFFDTYREEALEKRDVRKAYTDAVWKLLEIDESTRHTKRPAPPTVLFQWGQLVLFEAVITSITQRFTMFAPSGVPVRATLTVSFKQTVDPTQREATNPTSGGVGGERVWRVNDGDTLAWIAYKEYGDATKWRPIADANNLTRVRRLTPGTMLMVPHV